MWVSIDVTTTDAPTIGSLVGGGPVTLPVMMSVVEPTCPASSAGTANSAMPTLLERVELLKVESRLNAQRPMAAATASVVRRALPAKSRRCVIGEYLRSTLGLR